MIITIAVESINMLSEDKSSLFNMLFVVLKVFPESKNTLLSKRKVFCLLHYKKRFLISFLTLVALFFSLGS